jgi:UDP-N-acetylglucosamine--N-acetylmuramyl-(pentapeptide) pyrophosphoryl-undecaprenol N-acetylglucosamine transferase
VDDHQTGNARFLSDKGAAILLPQDELEPRKLAAVLEEMTREKAMNMAVVARGLAQPAAVQRVAQVCKELAG